MNRHSKQIVFVGLAALLVALPRCFASNSVQASQTIENQVIYLQATQSSAQNQPAASSAPPVVAPSTLQPQQVMEWVKKHPPAGVFVLVVLLYLGVLGLRPTWLLVLPLEKIPKIWLIPEIPIPPAISSFLKYRPRVLDAWVEQRIVQAQEEFNQRRTVGERSVYIPIPVEFNRAKPAIANFGIDDLRTVFSKRIIRLLIVGEGGVGKTSLACQIAKWAIADKDAERLCKHRMLPVLIEEELEAVEGKSPLLEAIARQIKSLRDDEKPVSEELLKQLLEKRRILVIVDHLSEMSEATQKMARLRDASSPVNALIVTSRLEDILGKEVTYTTLKPQRVSGKQLSIFMDAYLTQRGKRDLFDDPEYFDALRRLSQIVTDERNVTVLFAKLYADQMIAVAEGLVTEDLPDNIPDLMLNYVNEVNREKDGKIDDDIIQRDLKVIAWECLKQTFKPETAEREQVINCLAALEGEGEPAKESAKKRLKYLEERLALIRTVPPTKTKLRFALDPLAEHLAGLYLVRLYGEDEQVWQQFLDKARNQPYILEEIRGFLLILRDCCIAKSKEVKTPGFVIEALNNLVGADLEVLERERIKRTIQLLIRDLGVIDDKERVIHAAQRLERISEDIKFNKPNFLNLLKDAVPSLINLIKVEDEQLCISSQSSLTKIGLLAVPALIDLLKDEKVKVRRLAVGILRQIPSEAKIAVLALAATLRDDPDAAVRWNSAITLSKIIMAAKDEIPVSPLLEALIEAFKKDVEVGVRSYSAFALGKLGLKAKDAIPSLCDIAFKEGIEDFNEFVAVVEALEAIGLDLNSIEFDVYIDGITRTPKEVALNRREELHKEAELAKQSSTGIRLEWLPLLISFTPPQKDLYGTSADTPKWL